MKRAVVAAVVLAACAARVASAQSLGELAKREEERRKTIKSTAKVYTNDDLRSAGRPPAPAATPSAGPETPVSGAAAKPGADQKPADDKAKPDPKKEEAMWREKIAAARSALQRAQLFAEALQSRINALSNDFAARDDPAQRATLATDRQKALAELDRVKKEIDDDTKAIATIQDDARKAGVPPGWLR